jgi:hypothetical protein
MPVTTKSDDGLRTYCVQSLECLSIGQHVVAQSQEAIVDTRGGMLRSSAVSTISPFTVTEVTQIAVYGGALEGVGFAGLGVFVGGFGVFVGGFGGSGVFVACGLDVLVGLGPGVDVGATSSHWKCHVSLSGLMAPTTSPPWPWTMTTRQ